MPTRLFKVQCSMGLIASQLCICQCRGSLGKIRHFALNLTAIENDKCRKVIFTEYPGESEVNEVYPGYYQAAD